MFYLYLGYLSAQIYSTFVVINNTPMSLLALCFSIVVFLVWSFIPILGYVLARFVGAKGQWSNINLLAIGAFFGWIENGLFHYDLLNNNQLELGMLIVGVVFFLIAFVQVKPTRTLFGHS